MAQFFSIIELFNLITTGARAECDGQQMLFGLKSVFLFYQITVEIFLAILINQAADTFVDLESGDREIGRYSFNDANNMVSKSVLYCSL